VSRVRTERGSVRYVTYYFNFTFNFTFTVTVRPDRTGPVPEVNVYRLTFR
jgi:hypothetical protein